MIMRRLILSLFIIANTALGLACACPAASAPMDVDAQDHLHAYDEPADPAPGDDCCDDCDQHSAEAISEPLPVVIDWRLIEEDWDEYGNELPVALDLTWEDNEPPGAWPQSRTPLLPASNPVLLSDRMLE